MLRRSLTTSLGLCIWGSAVWRAEEAQAEIFTWKSCGELGNEPMGTQEIKRCVCVDKIKYIVYVRIVNYIL